MALLKTATASLFLLATLDACGGRVQRGEEAAPAADASAGKSNLAPTDGTGPLCIPSAGPTGGPLYVQKSFLIDPTGDNSGWEVTAQVMSTSPNSPLQRMKWSGNASFQINVDSLELVESMGPMSSQVIDQWAITNDDVTPGASCSASQTQNWVTTPWISWSFDKSNPSDLEMLNPNGQPSPLLSCLQMAGVQASLVPGSFLINENIPNTMSWNTQVVAQSSCLGMPASTETVVITFTFFRL
jgi:hypothetical protein